MTTPTPPPSKPGWPTVLTLPGQAAAVPGPVDVNNMYILHHAFRRDLRNFVAAAEATPATDRASWRRLSARWDVFAVELHRHHSHEDETLWPILRSRVDDEGRRVLDAMEAEHATIDPILDEIAAGFARLTTSAGSADGSADGSGAEAARAHLLAQLAAGQGNLDGHLAHEETAAIPLIQVYATQQDWEAFEKAAQKDGGIRALLQVVPWAAYGMDEKTRTDLFAAGPALLRIVWRLTHRRFDRREREVFGAVD